MVRYTLVEKVFDVCNLAMTFSVILLSVLFFLAFQEPVSTLVSINGLDSLPGAITPGSCLFGSYETTVIRRVGTSSVQAIIAYEGTVESHFDKIKASTLQAAPNEVLDCTSMDVIRLSNQSFGFSAGMYMLDRSLPYSAPGASCGGFKIKVEDYFYAGYYRVLTDFVEIATVESPVPIDFHNMTGVAIMYQSFQTVAGPTVDILSEIVLTLNFDEYNKKIKDIQFYCEYVPTIDASVVNFGLNTASMLVAILCFIAQTLFLFRKYTVGLDDGVIAEKSLV